MGDQLVIVTITGFVVAGTVLALSLWQAPRAARHRVPWTIALVLIGISLAFRLTIVVGATIAGGFREVLPVAIGEIAVACVFATAFRRPEWAGWVLIGTALGLPAMAAALELAGGGSLEQTVLPPLLGFYAVPAIASGGLLVASHRWPARERNTTTEPAANAFNP